MRHAARQAFTLVELVIVIAIVGILAAIAIPRFVDIRSEAHTAQRDSIIGSVRAGILTTAAKNQASQADTANQFPPNLEATWATMTGGTQPGSFPSTCNATDECFELVIPGGVAITPWVQTAAGTYTFTHPVTSAVTTCTYSNTVGTFICS